jgi:hypothetical protein
MKIYQSWKRGIATEGYSLTLTYIYLSKDLHEIEEIEKKMPKGTIIMDTDNLKRLYPLEQEGGEVDDT